MDIRNMIVDLWELAGEPSDLDPWAPGTVNYDPLSTDLDPTSAGVIYYLRQISLAQVALANWRTRKGRPIRFSKFQTQTNLKVGRDGSLAPSDIVYMDSYTVRLINPTSELDEDMLADTKVIFNGFYVQDGEDQETAQEAMIVRAVYDDINDWYTCSLRDEISNVAYTDDTGTEHTYDTMNAEIYFDRFEIVRTSAPLMDGTKFELPNKFRNIIKITNMDDGANLTRAGSKENLYNPQQSFGTPSNWYGIGDKIYFDTYLEEPIWHVVEYQRLPNDMTSIDQTIDIPEEWHEVLMLIVEWRVHKRMQDKQRANELFAEINRWIDTLRTDLEENWLREQTSGFQIRKEAR